MDAVSRDVVRRLQRQQLDTHSQLSLSLTQFGDFSQHIEDEAVDSPSPIIDRYYAIDGDRTLKTMTNILCCTS